MKKNRKKKPDLTVVSILIMAAVIIFAVAGVRYGLMMPFAPVKTAINEIAGYAGSIMSGPVHSLRHVWRNYLYLVDVREENTILKARILDLQAETTGYREVMLENRRLKNLLQMGKMLKAKTVVAAITGYDTVPWSWTVTIDKGRADRVVKDCIVLYGKYAAGRVVESFINFSRVMLINSDGSAVAALIQRNRARGILYGSENGKCRLEFVEKDVKLQKGDIVITSGTDGIFPKGIILGEVSSMGNEGEKGLFRTVMVKPAINLSRLEEVLVTTKASELIITK